ncbi:DapH/DapD/GlmU-related protein [Lysinibacillus sp. FSL P2-0066]|uniref:N-acetyltransferase n=1 Tax=Lysinibacillus sp. FSL P2-0066 TaxID=2921720 RepID=UPI0030DC9A04
MSSKISENALIHENVNIGENVVIHDFVVIYPNTKIGDNVEIFEGCVVGRKPTIPGQQYRKLKKEYQTLRIGKNSVLCPGVILYAGADIGENSLLGDHCSIREDSVIGDYCVVGRHVSINHSTKIGNNVRIMDGCRLTDMIVEDNVFISDQVATASDNTFGKEEYNPKNVVGPYIRKGAKIGAGATLLPHIIIGQNSVVGAGSVVTKSVPDGKVVIGNPARIKD